MHQVPRKHSWTSILFAVLAAGLWGEAAYGQGMVQGTVSDPLGAVVNGAKVTLQQGDTIVSDQTTNSQGGFSFSSVASGRYHLKISARGFADYTGSDFFVGSGTVNQEVALQVGLLKQELVVSATGSAIPVSQVGASVSLLDQQDFQAQNKVDTLENLRQVTGAQIVQLSQRGGGASLFIRGGESGFNKIMVDGVPANSMGGAFDFGSLSNGGIEQVEVLRGSNSVLYGADALAGVVNVTTKRGLTPVPELRFSTNGGNFGAHDHDVSLGGVVRQFDYFSQFNRSDTRGSIPNAFTHNATYAGNIGWSLNSKTSIRATVRKNWFAVGSPNSNSFFGFSDDSASKQQNTFVSGTIQNQTTSRWNNLARFAFAQFPSQFVNPTPTGIFYDPFNSGFPNYLGFPVTIRGANGYTVTGQGILDFGGTYPQPFLSYQARRSAYLQSDYQVTRDWAGTFGFRYEHENGVDNFTPKIIRDNYSYFMEGHGSVANRLFLTGGVGLENNASFGFAATPRVSAAYYLRQPKADAFFGETKLKFNFGRGIKESTISQEASQLYILLTPAQRAQLGVDKIGPERSRTLDFGITQGLWHGRSRVEVNYFQNRFYDLITFLNKTNLKAIGVPPAAADATAFGAYVNASSNDTKGVETDFVTELGRNLRFRAGYTYLDPVTTKSFGNPLFNPLFPNIPIGQFSPLQGARSFRRAPHTGTVGLTYTGRKLTASFTGYMVGKRDDSTFLSDKDFGTSLLLPNKDLAAAYQKFDLSGRYQLKPWVAANLMIENLFSQHYQAAFGYPAMPFTFRAGLTFTIGGEAWRKTN